MLDRFDPMLQLVCLVFIILVASAYGDCQVEIGQDKACQWYCAEYHSKYSAKWSYQANECVCGR